jgi:hypothetical protein
MESILHTMYVVAIKDTAAWAADGAADLSMIGFWNLVVVWLKVSEDRQSCSNSPLMLVAAHPVALLSVMGVARWDGPTGEYGSLRGQQLLHSRVLAELAQELQPVDRQVRWPPRPPLWVQN